MANQRTVAWVLLLAGMGLFGAPHASAQQCNPRFNYDQRLDVNDDGIIAPLDILLIYNFLQGVDTGDFVDVNNDGNVTPGDALMVINYLSDPGSFTAYNSDDTFDTDNDGFVNGDDLNVILALLFVPLDHIPAGFFPDVNMDGRVDFDDFWETYFARFCL